MHIAGFVVLCREDGGQFCRGTSWDHGKVENGHAVPILCVRGVSVSGVVCLCAVSGSTEQTAKPKPEKGLQVQEERQIHTDHWGLHGSEH